MVLGVGRDMRELMERLVVLPFTMGCASESSVSVGGGGGATQLKKSKSEPNPTVTRRTDGVRLKASVGLSNRVQKLIRTTLKGFSQMFVYKEEMEMEMEMEMEIGFPTDVKHVTHIGWDGSSTNPIKGWENLRTPDQLLANFPTISLRQFELAMAAQAHDPLLVTSSKLI